MLVDTELTPYSMVQGFDAMLSSLLGMVVGEARRLNLASFAGLQHAAEALAAGQRITPELITAIFKHLIAPTIILVGE